MMNLKIMCAPAVMGIAFMGLMSTANVAFTQEIDLGSLSAEEIMSMELDETDTVLMDEVDGALGLATNCTECANNVAARIINVVNKTNNCNNREANLELWRAYCKTHPNPGPIPNPVSFKVKCDQIWSLKKGIPNFYINKLAGRQACRDQLQVLVNKKNQEEHKCYGAPLYCGNDPSWPY
jgi:hypothetical protein